MIESIGIFVLILALAGVVSTLVFVVDYILEWVIKRGCK